MSHEAQERARRVIERCLSLGFAAAGACPASASAQADELRAWLDAGCAGTMEWMHNRVEVRTDVRAMLDGARSVVMVADLYATRGSRDEARPGFGRVARYARGGDYHTVIKKRLHELCDELAAAHPGERFRAFVDTAPVMERELAARCGIGWQGKHTLTIHPRLGSWMLLGGLVTTLDLESPPEQEPATDHCGTCTRCIDACPTDAITPYAVDARRCISYLTIEHRGPIEAEFHDKMGDWIFGCDICQEVCPHNSERPGQPAEANPAYEARRTGFDLLEVLGWNEDDRRAAFQGSSMKRAKLDMMRRNAAIAAANDPEARSSGLREALERIAGDESESAMLREAARASLDRLRG